MTETRGHVALTGGTGFLGPHIAEALRADGWSVRQLARRPQAVAAGNDVVPGSLFDDEALERLLRDVDVVVHAAGVIKTVSRDQFMRVNRDGSRRLAAAVKRQSRPIRVVSISSLAAREPGLSDYAASKRAGEDSFRAAGIDDWVVIRPTAVYGPGDREAAFFLRAAERPFLPVPRVPRGRVSVIYVTDVASAVTALCASGSPGKVFELTDHRVDGYEWRELAREILDASGNRARVIEVPRAVLRALATVSATASHVTRRAAMLGPGKVRELYHPDWSSSADRQPPPDMWRPRMELRDGLARTICWLRSTSRRRIKDN